MVCLRGVTFQNARAFTFFLFEIFHQRQEFLICNIIILVLPAVSRGVFKALDQILGLNKIAKLTVSYTWISFSVKCLVIIPQWCPVTHTRKQECPHPQNVVCGFLKRFLGELKCDA